MKAEGAAEATGVLAVQGGIAKTPSTISKEWLSTIFRGPVLLLLDEATTALDAESECLVQKALETNSAEFRCLGELLWTGITHHRNTSRTV